MSFISDFQMELVSQTSIIHYIEFQFERELDNVSKFLDVNIKKNLYDNNTEFMKKLIIECDKALEQINKKYIPEKPMPQIAQNIDAREPIGEVIDFCIEALNCEEPLTVVSLKEELEEANKISGENYYDFTDNEIEEIIMASKIILSNNKNHELYEQETAIEELKTSIKLVDNASTSNIFRQSFINIFSIFDAYVFENLKKYFCKEPKELEKFLEIKNNDKIKVNIDDVLLFENIEQLKENMIHKQFDGKYLSEMIKKLKIYNADIFSGIDYPMLLEMIERRNIHLHNKGFVDNKYHTACNIYKFNLNDYAYIDSDYLFIKVFNILSKFANNFERVFRLESI